MEKLAKYVWKVAGILDLHDWDITVGEGGLDGSDSMAECAAIYGQRRATIRFAREWPTWTGDTLRAVVAHELLHCHTADIAELVAATHTEALGKQARALADAAFDLAIEHCVDGVAVAIAKLLPYPKFAEQHP